MSTSPHAETKHIYSTGKYRILIYNVHPGLLTEFSCKIAVNVCMKTQSRIFIKEGPGWEWKPMQLPVWMMETRIQFDIRKS